MMFILMLESELKRVRIKRLLLTQATRAGYIRKAMASSRNSSHRHHETPPRAAGLIAKLSGRAVCVES